MPTPPSGLVTFLFTDIEGSTLRWEEAPTAMSDAQARHDQVLRSAVATFDGTLFKTIGDAFQIAFADPIAAVSTAVAAQRELAATDWSALGAAFGPLRVRMALHTGEAFPVADDYRTPILNRIARLLSSGHGGQILLTETVADRIDAKLPPGMLLRALGSHRLKDLREPETVFQVVVDGMPDVTTPLLAAGPRLVRDRIQVVDADGTGVGRAAAIQARAVTRPTSELLDLLGTVVRENTSHVALSMAEVRQLLAHLPADLTEYRLQRITEWVQPRYQLDDRFVALCLLVDKGEQSAKERWVPDLQRYSSLQELAADVEAPAVVVLGPPGSGKSTLLRRLELDLAIEGVRGESDTVSWFVPLGQYGTGSAEESLPDPGAWLAARWATRHPNLPPLGTFLAERRLLLLLDGLNEMPHRSSADYRARIRRWQSFLQDVVVAMPGNRAIFSCRSLDYSAPLSTSALRVPQARLEPMTDDQVKAFLDLHVPAQAADLWRQLAGSRQLELFRTPYLARLFVEQLQHDGTLPNSPAALFTGFVRESLRREVELGNPLLEPDGLLTERDLRQVVQASGWRSPFALPDRGLLVPRLEVLAYHMQTGAAADGSQVRLDYEAAIEVVGDASAEEVVQAGLDLGLLDEDTGADKVLFAHQLVQEYFAARVLARRPEPARLAVAWRAEEVTPSVGELLESLSPADGLPPLATTGWEETTVLAAPMAEDAEAFVAGLIESNLAIAGRTAALPGMRDRLSAALLDRLRWALVERSRDRSADLRARLDAARALGPLGDPRFRRMEGLDGSYLLPPLIEIPAGDYVIGDDQPIEFLNQVFVDHQPRHTVALAAFGIGQFPVTNAEWSHFKAAGGYVDLRWWDTPAAKSWQSGDATSAGTHAYVRDLLAYFRLHPDLVEEERATGRWTEELYERWKRRLAMTEAELESHLRELFPGGRRIEPHFWRDAPYNNPIQPVIGITWFEARAYCNWLAAQTGQPFRLPSEAEWEAAARGKAGRRYAYGEALDRLKANTLETHLRQVSPIGVFPDGDTPEGIADLSGNIYVWTNTAWGMVESPSDFPYPYRPDDGREDPGGPPAMRRVLRGGSWYDYAPMAQAFARLDTGATDRLRPSGVGLRVACTTETPRVR